GVKPAVRRAGKLGDGWIAAPDMTLEDALELQGIYYNHSQSGTGHVCMMKDAWVGDTQEVAWQEYSPYLMDTYRYYWTAGSPDYHGVRSEEDVAQEALTEGRLIIGDPEQCVSQFRSWQNATGCDNYLLRLRHAHAGGPPHEAVMTAIKRFGRDVIPYLQ
ncbi:LLM class flavin-dependent oxidoreductase, partial [SAR202 cluster bacterium AD-804-J14_MRT_500m]|nr:LLM class flavin-dependent oxidoreductase [SAR202 cluster bacterium AD-804-J14_MRT_500m]